MLHPSTRKLIDKLSEMTKARKIDWREGEGETCFYDTEGYRVLLAKTPPSLQLLDAAGRELERADQEVLAATPSETGATYVLVLDEMYAEACRQAAGTEAAIDKIVGALDLDGDGIPDIHADGTPVTEEELETAGLDVEGASGSLEPAYPDEAEMAAKVASLASGVNGPQTDDPSEAELSTEAESETEAQGNATDDEGAAAVVAAGVAGAVALGASVRGETESDEETSSTITEATPEPTETETPRPEPVVADLATWGDLAGVVDAKTMAGANLPERYAAPETEPPIVVQPEIGVERSDDSLPVEAAINPEPAEDDFANPPPVEAQQETPPSVADPEPEPEPEDPRAVAAAPVPSTNWLDEAKDMASAASGAVSDKTEAALDTASDVASDAASSVSETGASIIHEATSVADAAKDKTLDAATATTDTANDLARTASATVSEAASNAVKTGQGVLGGLGSKLKSVADNAGDVAEKAAETGGGLLGGSKSAVSDAADTAKSAAGSAVESASDFVSDAVETAKGDAEPPKKDEPEKKPLSRYNPWM